MNRKALFISTIFIAVGLVLGSAFLARAQSAPLSSQNKPAESPAPEVALGQPGLSYRYVKTLGTTGVPYITDNTHLNRPMGIFIDSANNLYMTEDPGNRVLKFNSAKTNLLTLGVGGVCEGGNTGFCSPRDIAIDKIGNIWVVDANRAAQYDSSGTFLQEFPSTDPWNSGNTNNRFEEPSGIAFDSTGRMFVSDTRNQRIQVFDMTTGSPVYSTTIGVTDVTGTTPGYFDTPMRVAIDSLNRLYVAEIGNNRVQRCTYSSGWTCVVVDANYNGAQGIAIDESDSVYITDTFNFRIRKCTSTGSCTTWATDTRGHYDLAVDALGNVYGSSPYENIIDQFDSTGTYQGIYIGVHFEPYQADNDHYFHPRVAVDPSNNILIIEENGHRLIKLDPNGTFLWSFGVPGVDAWDDTHLNYPHSVATDKNGNVYVAGSCEVKKISASGTYLNTIGPACGTGNFEFGWATGVDVDLNGNIYVADYSNQRVMIYDSGLNYIGQIGETGVCNASNDHLCTPIAVETDSTGNIYVTDAGNARVQKFNSSRQWVMTIGTGIGGDQFDQFNWAEDVAVDAQGKIFITDWSNNRVQVYDSTGKYLTTIGGAWGSNSSQLKGAPGVDVDSKGNVYVADWDNARIQVFAPGVPGWKQANINGFGDKYLQTGALEVFNGQLYAGTTDWNNLNAIYRSSDGKTWEQVKDLGYRGSVIDMTVFNGQLYASTGWGADNTAARIYRTSDGTTWNEVATAGFGNIENLCMDFLAVFQNKIYVTVCTSDSSPNGVSIWRSDSGDPDTWEAVVTDGKGDTNNHQISAMVEYNGYLYAGVHNIVNGTRIWRTSDGNTWNQVNADGFGDARNIETITFAVFQGNLYAGVWTNQVSNGQIWRSSNGTTWNSVITDGFGDPNKPDTLGLYVFENRLYATTNNNVTGTEVWATSDGDHWSQVNIDGWGDSNNGFSLRGNAGANFKNNLFISVMNGANGGEVWQMLHQVFLPFMKK
jgi:hypothetical protein